ncbi:Fe-S cluster assembly protein SufD [Acidocella sp.]|uniref:Fe-S cluster assembly protein SufD n=1 Tax=Acidocella sp. TaxID=50710 RepID=UPI002608F390|nr:Fe-S cluster assembly protein SufD [Acidocella sp.]
MTALPTKKLEAWRYTDLRALERLSFGAVPAAALPALPEFAGPIVVFANGRMSAPLAAPLGDGREFAPVQEHGPQSLAHINAEQAQDGLSLSVPAGIDGGALLMLSHNAGETPFAAHPRHRVTLGDNARLTLIELVKGEGVYWHNPVADIALHGGAVLTHIRLQQESTAAFNTTLIRANVAAGAAYEHFTATIGAKLSRTELHVSLLGEGARADLNAAQLLRGEQHGDFTAVVRHAAPNCASRQTVKSVLADDAHGVFQGRIEVAKGAQKTDGYQMSRALLLSERATMDIKPELEIFADDVKCSHGATIGALDAEQLFYLRSRGINEPEARAMLIHAFLEEAFAPVTDEAAHKLLIEAIGTWWTTP